MILLYNPFSEKYILENIFLSFPWWFSGKESACQCRRHGFYPLLRKIPHAAWSLHLCATATEPVLWSPGAATTEPRQVSF